MAPVHTVTVSSDENFPLLDDIGFCKLCYLRIWKRNTFSFELEKHYRELKEDSLSGAAAKLQKRNPCILCLDLLSHSMLENCLATIKSILESEKYQVENDSENVCALSLSLPPVIFIRERTVKMFLCEKYDGLLDLTRRSAFITLKEAWKMSLHHLLESTKQIFDDDSPLIMTVNVIYANNIEECSKLLPLNANMFPNNRKKNADPDDVYTRNSVSTAVDSASDSDLRSVFPVPPTIPACPVSILVTAQHLPVFVAGRYNKYSRELSQTPWVVDGERKTASSVEELVCDKVKEVFKASSQKFSSSGREDVDVRMLGDGRPFVIELVDAGINSLSPARFRELEKEINKDGRVRVRGLQVVSKEEIKQLKEGEEDKKKTYHALCISKTIPRPELVAKLADLGVTVLDQKTPIRVLHRRPLAVRKRTVEGLKFEQLDRKQGDFFLFSLELTTQAGTYVKEFVHSDFGRTVPNLSSMLEADIDIIALDVVNIHIDWPPAIPE